MVRTILLLAAAASAAPQFDLGGPCKDVMGPGVFREIDQATKAGDWSRLVELQKQSVRESCGNEYRWASLVVALLRAGRQPEALAALQEMDARGLDLNFSNIPGGYDDLNKFMATALFKSSPLGVKIDRLKRASDARRARFREALQKLSASQKPPDHYVAKGACPFECCHYGSWTVLEDADLVAAPGSARVVGKARKGTRVTAVTGEVHLEPEPFVVLRDGDLPKDTIAFVLDYQGEGYANVYTRGKIVSASVVVSDYCFRISDACWGETLEPERKRPKPVWWVKIRLANGVVGWTNRPERFDDKDACG